MRRGFPRHLPAGLDPGLAESYGTEIFTKRFRGMERTIEEGLEFCRVLVEAKSTPLMGQGML